MSIVAGTTDGLITACEILRRGGIVALPTESSYGLATDPFHPGALERLFRLKRRAADKPVLVLIDSISHQNSLAATLHPLLAALTDKFWPGPLTVVCPAKPGIPRLLTGPDGTVAMRRTSHPVAARLVRLWDGPLTATSANISGEIPARRAQDVCAVFGEGVDMILDGGSCPGGVSTIVGIRDSTLAILRPGMLDVTKLDGILYSRNKTRGGELDGD